MSMKAMPWNGVVSNCRGIGHPRCEYVRGIRMVAVVLLCMSIISSVVHAQSEQSLKDALLKHTVVVRSYYTGSVLQFDTSGQLVSPAETGFGIDDASVYVTDVRLSPEKLIIEGQRTFQAYDEKSKQFQLALAADKVELEIALPADKPASAAIPELLKKVLLTEPEMQNNCTPEESGRFQDLVQGKEPHKKKENASNAQGLPNLPALCFPTGEKAYRIGGAVKPPKAIKTSDPEYPLAAEKTKQEGTARIFIIVDQQGRATTVYLMQSAGQHLDQAAEKVIRKWQFQPTLFEGAPIPVAVNVVLNFHLH
jgi:TonB family protein